jgi:beta-aspartyl-peptidase (threonine type)
MQQSWSIIVHGGAGLIRAGREERKRRGMLAAVAAGQALLEAGGGAVAAVEAAIRVMEDDPVFNAGFGSVLNAEGEVETDAAIMDGASLDAGAVTGLRGVRNPITVARALMGEHTVMLAGEGARAFAATHRGLLCDPAEMIAPERADEAKDTVGCVACDRAGNLAAGTSTGGISKKPVGRVGDSPIVGGGLYAENQVGAVAFSGDGEAILRLSLAMRLICDLADQDAPDAARRAIAQMDRVRGEAGVIVLGPSGEPAFAHNSPHFAVAMAGPGRPARAFLSRDEWDGR